MKMIDYELLENKFFYTQKDVNDAVFSMNAAELLDAKNMDEFIQTYTKLLKAYEPAVAGTFFCGWIRYICLVQQYVVSVYNCALDLSLSNLTIQLYLKDNYSWFSFKYNEIRENRPNGRVREEWLEEVFTSLYRDQIRPLFEAVAKSAKIDVGQLWGQLPSSMQNYIDTFIEETEDHAVRQQIADDYHYLCKQMDAEIFGRKRNPFDVKFRMIENPRVPDKQSIVKTSCCLYYRTEGGTHCYTCPRLTDEEREERRKKMLAQ